MKAIQENTFEVLDDKLTVESNDEQYLGDFYNDDVCLREEIECFDYVDEAVNDDVWHVLSLDSIEDTLDTFIY